MNRVIGFFVYFAFAVVSAALFPWWTTAIVAALGVWVLNLSVRWVTVATLITWTGSCAVRDAMNDYAPSLVFARLLRLQDVLLAPGGKLETSAALASGFQPELLLTESTVRLVIYLLVGVIGAVVAFSAAGAAKHLRLAWLTR